MKIINSIVFLAEQCGEISKLLTDSDLSLSEKERGHIILHKMLDEIIKCEKDIIEIVQTKD